MRLTASRAAALRALFLGVCIAALVVKAAFAEAMPVVTERPLLAFEDPLYLDPSYYNGYYGYWREHETGEGSAFV